MYEPRNNTAKVSEHWEQSQHSIHSQREKKQAIHKEKGIKMASDSLTITLDQYLQISFFFFFCFFWGVAASAAYGSSQARGRIGAVAAGLHHSHSNAATPQP